VNQAPKQLVALFLLAIAGVLVAVGLVVQAAAGAAGAVVYVALLLGLLLVGRRQVRRRARAAALSAGRTCTCCTGTVHDPVQVV
jgi:hypothetical protein